VSDMLWREYLVGASFTSHPLLPPFPSNLIDSDVGCRLHSLTAYQHTQPNSNFLILGGFHSLYKHCRSHCIFPPRLGF